MSYEYRKKAVILPVTEKEAIVRQADATIEDILWDGQDRIDEVLPDYLAACTLKLGDIEKPTRKDILDLPLPDKYFLSIEIYRVTMGDSLILRGACGYCDEPAGYEVRLDQLDIIPKPEDAEGPDPMFYVTLPETGNRVGFGYRTGHHEMEEGKRKGVNLTRGSLQAIRSVNGSTEFRVSEVKAWPLPDHEALRRAIREKECGYDPRVRFKHKCGKSEVMNLTSDPSFLMPGVPL
jgi:hypothetical protein